MYIYATCTYFIYLNVFGNIAGFISKFPGIFMLVCFKNEINLAHKKAILLAVCFCSLFFLGNNTSWNPCIYIA